MYGEINALVNFEHQLKIVSEAQGQHSSRDKFDIHLPEDDDGNDDDDPCARMTHPYRFFKSHRGNKNKN